MIIVLRLFAWMLALVLVLMPVVAVLNGWIGADRWPMRQLSVTGEFKQVSDAQIRSAVMLYVQRGFFAVDPAVIRDSVAHLPWVDTVSVRKRWPDRLEVAYTEHHPIAYWGEKKMLAESGQMLAVVSDARALPLPHFNGPDERAVEVVAFYQQAQSQFVSQPQVIAEVNLSLRGSWSVVLSDGLHIEVGGADAERRLSRFFTLLPKINADSARQLQRADLRYTNGFALTWRQAPASPAPSPPMQVQVSS